MNKINNLRNNLKKNLDLLKKSLNVFLTTYSEVEEIINNNNTDFKQDLLKEAFVARFSRTLDIFTQKVIKNFCLVTQEYLPTFIDRANFLEKLEIINSADDLQELRILRNEIAHEYQEENLHQISQQVFKATKKLENMVLSLEEYLYNANILTTN